MPVVNVMFEVNQTVFYVGPMTAPNGPITAVAEAIVKSSSVSIRPTGTTISYNIQFVIATNGSASVEEDTLYPDVDSALAAYRVIINCQGNC